MPPEEIQHLPPEIDRLDADLVGSGARALYLKLIELGDNGLTMEELSDSPWVGATNGLIEAGYAEIGYALDDLVGEGCGLVLRAVKVEGFSVFLADNPEDSIDQPIGFINMLRGPEELERDGGYYVEQRRSGEHVMKLATRFYGLRTNLVLEKTEVGFTVASRSY